MIFDLYTVRDLLADEHGPIFQAKNKAVAERNYHQLLEKQKLNAEEYELVKIGEFDNETGVLTTV